MAIAETAIQLRAWKSGARARDLSLSWRSAAYLTAALASNIPDLDLVLSPLTAGQLGYLLHHRGYTHTLVMALPQAALATAIPWLLARTRAYLWTARDYLWLGGLALVGTVAHMGLDYGNSYGVHLLWPFDDRWSYGDSVFIVEPAFWLALVPMLVAALRSGFVRTALLAVFALAVFLELGSGFVPRAIGGAFVAMGLGLFYLNRKLSGPWRATAGVSAFLATLALMYGAGAAARQVTERALAAAYPGWKTADTVLTPLASDPLCHSLIAIQTQEGGDGYALRRGVVSLAPGLLPAADCPDLRMGREGTLRLTPVREPHRGVPPDTAGAEDTRHVAWEGAAELSRARLQAAYAEDCVAHAFFRFARAPFYVTALNGDLVLGDLRFDRGRGRGPSFAELTLPAGGSAPCPERVPPWVPPRRGELERSVR